MTNHMYRILLLLLCIGSGYAQELPQSPISAGRDTEVAAFLLALAVPLALKLNDPYALRRLEEFEAEYYKLTGKNIQSLTLMKQRYHKAQKHHETSAPLLVNTERRSWSARPSRYTKDFCPPLSSYALISPIWSMPATCESITKKAFWN